MRKLLIFLLFFSFIKAYSQGSKHFDCDFFSFDYPTSFRQSPIKNSPDMKIKLVSDNYGLYIACTEVNWDESKSIWDDQITERLYNNYGRLGQIVSSSKTTIQLKGGTYKCLKFMTNSQKQKQGEYYNLRNLTYLLFQNGCLYVVGFSSEGKYASNSSTSYPEKILKGLLIKEDPSSTKKDFSKYLLEVVKQLNAQCPMEIDACTTHLSVVLSGHTVMIKTQIDDSCEGLVDYDEFKDKMCNNFSVALEKSFVQYLKSNNYSVVYMIYNENDRLKKKVSISGQDILKYYK